MSNLFALNLTEEMKGGVEIQGAYNPDMQLWVGQDGSYGSGTTRSTSSSNSTSSFNQGFSDSDSSSDSDIYSD